MKVKCMLKCCRKQARKGYVTTTSKRVLLLCVPHMDRHMKELQENAHRRYKSARSLNSYLRSIESRCGDLGFQQSEAK